MAAGFQQISLKTALENMSRELDMLAQRALALDEALGEAIGSSDAACGLPVALMQDVDLVRQSADCLRIVMGNLVKIAASAPQPPDLLEASAVVDGVYLAALSDRVVAVDHATPDMRNGAGDWIDL